MATFDIKKVIDELEAALKQVAISHAPEVVGATSAYMIRGTERLSALADGSFDSDYITSHLEEEEDIIKSELASYEVFAQMLARDAQDTTIKQILAIVITVLGQVIINKA